MTVVAAAAPFATHWSVAVATGALSQSPEAFPQSLASGDPRPGTVLLWTRAPAADGSDVTLRLQVAEDAGFSSLRIERELTALAEADHCLRVRVRGLQPGRAYHYRFLRQVDGAWVSSAHGRTRTAPAPDAATPPMRFAFMSCQDYSGRWYNSLLPLQDEDLDFILHLGDFIYETVGDASFQSSGGERSIRFDDSAGALHVHKEGRSFHAARSLDNYRQLHRTFRTDPVLQKLLERAPLVAVWDDHEFSDDCWQDVATYHDGLHDERDTQRRRNAEQAYFEYMPVDIEIGDEAADGSVAVDAGQLFPRTRLWRELRFGRDMQLLLLDYRSTRPDHPIPEDAFPGALVYDAHALESLLPASGFDAERAHAQLLPYLDLGAEQHRHLRRPLLRALTRGYAEAGLDAREARARAQAAVDAPMALLVVRDVLTRYNAAVPAILRVQLPDAQGDYPLGLPWLAMGKQKLLAEMGSRYFVVKDAYELLLALRAADPDHVIAPALGQPQQDWLGERLQASSPRWRLLGTSVAMVPMVIDLRDPALDVPQVLRRQFYLNVDQWDGFGNQRDALVRQLDAGGGALVFSGDIHSGFATEIGTRSTEFTTPAISSTPLHEMMLRSATSDPATAEAGRQMVESLERMLPDAEPRMKYAQLRRHGFGLVEIDGDAARVSLYEVPAELSRQSHYATPGAAIAQGHWVRFAVDAEGKRLHRLD